MAEDQPIRATEDAEAAYERRVKAVEESIDKYHAYLRNYLFSLTRQWQDAENLEQELWKSVLLKFEESQIGEFALLRRKAYQLFIDHYRKMVRRGETLSESVPEQAVRFVSAESVSDEQEKQFRTRFWSEYPDVELNEAQKEAIWLHARYGFTYKEIEERLGVPSSTIGDWITLARKELAESINRQNKG